MVIDYLRTRGVVRTQKDFANLIGIGANNLSGALNGRQGIPGMAAVRQRRNVEGRPAEGQDPSL